MVIHVFSALQGDVGGIGDEGDAGDKGQPGFPGEPGAPGLKGAKVRTWHFVSHARLWIAACGKILKGYNIGEQQY